MSTPVKKVVLAYSGGLDTSVILTWLIETYRCEVVAYCADLGQGEELIPVREKALRTGASQVHIRDLREEFVRDFIFPMLRASAIYEGAYLMGTSIARPLIAKAQVDIARETGADAVSHGSAARNASSAGSMSFRLARITTVSRSSGKRCEPLRWRASLNSSWAPRAAPTFAKAMPTCSRNPCRISLPSAESRSPT